jgi:hypothetical protein
MSSRLYCDFLQYGQPDFLTDSLRRKRDTLEIVITGSPVSSANKKPCDRTWSPRTR